MNGENIDGIEIITIINPMIANIFSGLGNVMSALFMLRLQIKLTADGFYRVELRCGVCRQKPRNDANICRYR